MNSRRINRAPGGRAVAAIVAALALVAMLFSQLGAVAGAAPSVQGPDTPATPEPEATPVATPGAGELPAEARAALEAFLAATGGTEEGVAAAAAAEELPVGLANSFTYMHLPLLLQLSGTGQGPLTPTPPTETPTEEPEPETADISVRLWADPSIRVIRGGTFVYEIRVRNHGEASADSISVSLPYRRDQYTLLEGRFDASKGDWVSDVGNTSIGVTFGRLAPGAERTGRLIFRAAGNLPTDTILDIRATYGWDDAGDGAADRRSNWMPLLVGAGNASAPWVWTIIDPTSGPASTTFRAQSNRFIPGETVVTWLNTPSGVKSLDLRGTADALGAVSLALRDQSLPAGNYSIVLYGQRSGLTGVANFSIR